MGKDFGILESKSLLILLTLAALGIIQLLSWCWWLGVKFAEVCCG